eukprot:scaffold103550_cov23-Cyclotella_meneghiniana.AAC.1
MKLSIAITYSILSSVTPAIIATKEDEINLLTKKVEELTAVVEAQGRTLQQLLSPSQNEHRFLAKSSKSKPTPQPTSSSIEPVACLMNQYQCSDLKTNVLGAQAHQTADVVLTHTEQCQTFKYLLDKQADEPTVRDNLLKAMHCETVPDDKGTQYEMFEISTRPDWYYNVTSTDPLGPQYMACNGFVNVGTCNSESIFSCLWFTNGYVAETYDIAIGVDIGKVCADYCQTDPFCKASYFLNKIGNERTCNIIHVSPTIPDASRFTCGSSNSNRVFVKQEVDSDYCKVGEREGLEEEELGRMYLEGRGLKHHDITQIPSSIIIRGTTIRCKVGNSSNFPHLCYIHLLQFSTVNGDISATLLSRDDSFHYIHLLQFSTANGDISAPLLPRYMLSEVCPPIMPGTTCSNTQDLINTAPFASSSTVHATTEANEEDRRNEKEDTQNCIQRLDASMRNEQTTHSRDKLLFDGRRQNNNCHGRWVVAAYSVGVSWFMVVHGILCCFVFLAARKKLY